MVSPTSSLEMWVQIIHVFYHNITSKRRLQIKGQWMAWQYRVTRTAALVEGGGFPSATLLLLIMEIASPSERLFSPVNGVR